MILAAPLPLNLSPHRRVPDFQGDGSGFENLMPQPAKVNAVFGNHLPPGVEKRDLRFALTALRSKKRTNFLLALRQNFSMNAFFW